MNKLYIFDFDKNEKEVVSVKETEKTYRVNGKPSELTLRSTFYKSDFINGFMLDGHCVICESDDFEVAKNALLSHKQKVIDDWMKSLERQAKIYCDIADLKVEDVHEISE